MLTWYFVSSYLVSIKPVQSLGGTETHVLLKSGKRTVTRPRVSTLGVYCPTYREAYELLMRRLEDECQKAAKAFTSAEKALARAKAKYAEPSEGE